MPQPSLGFIGAGQMGRALARGFVEAGRIAADDIWAYDPVPEAGVQLCQELPGVHLVESNAAVVRAASVVFLAVKPQSLNDATAQVSADQSGQPLFVSIVAGVTLATLCDALGSRRVVRVMPNTPCLVGCGASGYALADGASEEDAELVRRLLEAVGVAFRVAEPLLDAVTGLSGSGPAYVYAVIEALSDGGVRMGLPRDTAAQLAAQTVLGAARMVQEGGEHPAVLRDRVTSPAGTTIAGLQLLERRGFRSALIDAVEAATLRARELGSGSQGPSRPQ